jgi:hypothetical protein
MRAPIDLGPPPRLHAEVWRRGQRLWEGDWGLDSPEEDAVATVEHGLSGRIHRLDVAPWCAQTLLDGLNAGAWPSPGQTWRFPLRLMNVEVKLGRALELEDFLEVVVTVTGQPARQR